MAKNFEERTLVLIQPDGVQRGLVSKIMKRFEEKGFKLVAMKFLNVTTGQRLPCPSPDLELLPQPSKAMVASHYSHHEGECFYEDLVEYMVAGPVVATVWEGLDAVKLGRLLIGKTQNEPSDAVPGTIRGDLRIQIGRCIVHGSDSIESAQKEIAIWFNPREMVEWTPALGPWVNTSNERK